MPSHRDRSNGRQQNVPRVGDLMNSQQSSQRRPITVYNLVNQERNNFSIYYSLRSDPPLSPVPQINRFDVSTAIAHRTRSRSRMLESPPELPNRFIRISSSRSTTSISPARRSTRSRPQSPPITPPQRLSQTISNNSNHNTRPFRVTRMDDIVTATTNTFRYQIELSENLDPIMFEMLIPILDDWAAILTPEEINNLCTSYNHPHVRTEEECTICLNNLEFNDLMRRLPCFHEFHQECIDQWFSSRNTCPLCRRPLHPQRT